MSEPTQPRYVIHFRGGPADGAVREQDVLGPIAEYAYRDGAERIRHAQYYYTSCEPRPEGGWVLETEFWRIR